MTEETPCPKREDKIHCNCWYDGEKCCACGDAAKEEVLVYDDDAIEQAKRIGWHLKKQAEGYRLNSPGGSFYPCRQSPAHAWKDLPENWREWKAARKETV